MRYSPEIHHRRSIRLPGYDYSAVGYYFVTMCSHDRELVFVQPEIRDVVESAWVGLSGRFSSLALDEFVVMPNHVHGIIALQANPGPAPALGKVMRAFKSLSAIEVNRMLDRHGRPLWQRNYYERIIRTERELFGVREYIQNNPLNWDEDPDNPSIAARANR